MIVDFEVFEEKHSEVLVILAGVADCRVIFYEEAVEAGVTSHVRT